MQYKVIVIGSCFSTKRALEKLAKEVNDAIADGWEPLGGVACNQAELFQALIKRH
jgi:hypothetical protein